MEKKIGFFRKTNKSNSGLVAVFEEIQNIRFQAKNKDWEDPKFEGYLNKLEETARKNIERMFKRGELHTSDDFYRAAFIFHHGHDFKSYALAVTLAAVSNHLGEPWGKNLYAVALDRFMLSIMQPQFFGTQFEMKNKKWRFSPLNNKITDEERKKYLVENMNLLKKRLKKLNKTSTFPCKQVYHSIREGKAG